MTPEGKVKLLVRKGLEENRILPFSSQLEGRIGSYYMPVQTGYGQRAVDFICVIRGRFVAIETKRPDGGELTEAQTHFLRSTDRSNGVSIVARCWEDVAGPLRQMGFI